MTSKKVAIIGAGPAGLIAAERLSAQGFQVSVYERKPSVARKFLMAGRGGLNLTHSEDFDFFVQKYDARREILKPMIEAFTPQMLREWCEGLGEKTFVGTSGRVFPENFKASPLLRAWTRRLESQNVTFMMNHEWAGWDKDALVFNTARGAVDVNADATLLALGGASWPKLGSDGSWVYILKRENVEITPLQATNCGFVVKWSDIFAGKYAGKPLKSVVVSFKCQKINGEMMITTKGVEGGAIYALSSALREEINKNESATFHIDLKPDVSTDDLAAKLNKPKARKSLSNFLRSAANLPDVVIGLLMESPERTNLGAYSGEQLAALIKHYPVTVHAPFTIDRAISSAGGVTFDAVDETLMLRAKPGVFVAGEMLDWEAPTGGYLLQASFATGVCAAKGIAALLK